MTALNTFLSQALQERAANNLLRVRQQVDSPCGVTLQWQGKSLLNFCSNDYLGHANHPLVKKAFVDASETWGVGSGASHLISGHSREHQALEDELAAMLGVEAALVFSTGFMANTGIISALMSAPDAVFEDRLNHASLLDGGLQSGARFSRYAHNDIDALSSKLARVEARHKLIVSDAVFSMDGDIAPLPELLACAEQHDAWLMIDDAHGFGVLGEKGLGAPEHFAIAHKRMPIYMATLGKAIGTFGAFVAGSRELIDYLVQFARPYVYTTAMPAAIAAATRASLSLLQTESWRREKLHELIAHFRRCGEQAGLSLMPSITPIQPLLVGDSEKALRLSAALREKGFWISAIRPPTVPENSARLRITLSAEHRVEQIDALVDALHELLSSET
ncbi:8-amino-7-oxononanoate synthase [Permianibacter aggregans]|uniref:8-amino-7-oxononanoate synthase n=1 Tax=Permianibacter aggregans TaxID=1510150 RepID=A0A4R6UUA8_9GAMM|nr:8-amino-7-oxononanoate synthase [Permianibacter aggregans]QGX40502.1 8-amino-7-oxononanoate synthase [Permianibacter aggregans]TDQ49353.1 8-amino-7-oxononanoate synthase [Permianibacter aggregans]